MNLFLYLFTYPFIWLFSRLPMRVLYIFSDMTYLLIFYVIKYRKNVVTHNLTTAFPDMTDKELKQISKQFYNHFTDIMFESIKSIGINKDEISKRYKYKNVELLEELSKQGKGIILLGAHQGNWEWLFNLPLFFSSIHVYATYSALTNPYFDKIIRKARSKFGGTCVKTSETNKLMLRNYLEKKSGLHILLSDQSPLVHKSFYWKDFFGIKLPVHTGAEMLAKKLDFTVVYFSTKKIKRGYYISNFKLITDKPKEYKNFSITDSYFKMLEESIKQQPQFYLWTHRRFKHKNRYQEWLRNNKQNKKKM
ncbi:MAG: lysophospholipid acyltransferase family protein [Tenacibaculum sp.]